MTLTPRAQELVQPLEDALQSLNALLHARSFNASKATRETMLAQLLDGETDLALGVFPNPHKDIAFHTLFDDHFVSIAARGTLPPRGGLSLDEWLARRHVVVSMRPDAYNEIDGALATQGLRRRIGLVLPDWSAATDVLAGTDLLLTVARRALERMPRGRGLKTFAPPIALPTFPFQQAWHTRRDGDPAHGWLRQMVWECGQP